MGHGEEDFSGLWREEENIFSGLERQSSRFWQKNVHNDVSLNGIRNSARCEELTCGLMG